MEQLIAVVDRLAEELAATQVALRDLTLELARQQQGADGPAAAGPGEPPRKDPVTGEPLIAEGGAPESTVGPASTTAEPQPSAVPPRRADHAVDPDAEAPALWPAPALAPSPDDVGRPVSGPSSQTHHGSLIDEHVVGRHGAAHREYVASLAGVPLLSAGAVDVTLGPVGDLDELDALEARIGDLHGVHAVAVSGFEGRDVLLSVDLDRPLPLAGMLRTELGRAVASCRLVEGRIVVRFAAAGTPS